jgi:RNA polymerase sigma-70 factor (ECF subfamily)
LVEKYQGAIRSFFLSQTAGDEATSDDLAQETFIRAWRNLSAFRGLASFKTWLFAIAYRILLDHFRSLHPADRLDDLSVEAAGEAESVDTGLSLDFDTALQRLSPPERTCILLFYQEDLSIKKIAEITQMPEGTVKSHLARGKSRLAKFLNHEGYEYNRYRPAASPGLAGKSLNAAL